jgi:uncharacterized protein YehS (DUF1456 family)
MTDITDKDRNKAEKILTRYELESTTVAIAEAIAQAREEGRQEMKEMASKAVEDHLIYTRPGGIDQEPIQKILAKAIRKL